jgi:hypothetical protein
MLISTYPPERVVESELIKLLSDERAFLCSSEAEREIVGFCINFSLKHEKACRGSTRHGMTLH